MTSGHPRVGPLAAFVGLAPDYTVSIIEPSHVPAGTLRRRLHVQENRDRFDVQYYRFDGYRGLYHGSGKNWILWTEDERHFFVSVAPENRTRDWVHARFVLRHLIAAGFLARPGYHRLHAVVGSLTCLGDRAGLAIAGPFQAGKTFLLEQLIERGVVGSLLEDDCAIFDPDWQAHCLLPAEHELRCARQTPVRLLLCLDPSATSFQQVPPQEAAAWAFPMQASWPVTWLPGFVPPATDVRQVPASVRCARGPARPPLEDALRAVEQLLPRDRA